MLGIDFEKLGLSGSVRTAYAAHYPDVSDEGEVLAAVEEGEPLETETALGLLGRNGRNAHGSRYVLHPQRTGIFIIAAPPDDLVVTYAAFQQAQIRRAIELWGPGHGLPDWANKLLARRKAPVEAPVVRRKKPQNLNETPDHPFHHTHVYQCLANRFGSRNAAKLALDKAPIVPVEDAVVNTPDGHVRPEEVRRCKGDVLAGLWHIDNKQYATLVVHPDRRVDAHTALPYIGVPIKLLRVTGAAAALFRETEEDTRAILRRAARAAVWQRREDMTRIDGETFAIRLSEDTLFLCLCRQVTLVDSTHPEWQLCTAPISAPTQDDVDAALALLAKGWTVVPPRPDHVVAEPAVNFPPMDGGQ